jgi:hypothetical protein
MRLTRDGPARQYPLNGTEPRRDPVACPPSQGRGIGIAAAISRAIGRSADTRVPACTVRVIMRGHDCPSGPRRSARRLMRG